MIGGKDHMILLCFNFPFALILLNLEEGQVQKKEEREERKKGRETTGESLELDQGLLSPSLQSPEESTGSADRNITQDGK